MSTILDKRANGVLMHISSLPGSTGIGTLGASAYSFVDFLHNAKQTYWQILPICPTSYGDSPYQSFSTFAGNPYFIDLDFLVQDGLLQKSDFENVQWGQTPTQVDYATLYYERKKIFQIIQTNFEKNIPSDFDDFCKENKFWLDEYSLFMAIKDAHNGVSFDQWEDDIRRHDKTAVSRWKKQCGHQIQYYKILQYLFFKQWFALKAYANQQGINIIGDIPIYVAADSADVWSNPAQFCMDQNLHPVEVAGCPPDGFSATGQLWGNPVYNWDFMKTHKYEWWKKRIQMCLKNYDVIRIDHFRGFDSYYCIPYGNPTAENGVWRQGPGMDLFHSIEKKFGELPIIAENLGFLTDSVNQLLEDSGFPGMKLLQFAFDSREKSEYLPYYYIRNTSVYTGTHDNDTILGWAKTAPSGDVEYAKKFYRAETDEDLRREMILSAMGSVSNTCIICMQDLIKLGSEARMNTPSTVGTNWKWRALAEEINEEAANFLLENTVMYGRS